MTIDWLDDFTAKAGMSKTISTLKDSQFYGTVSINFCAGNIVNADVKQHINFTSTASNATYTTSTQPKLQGGSNAR